MSTIPVKHVLTGGSQSDIYLSIQAKRAGKIKGEAVTPGHVDDIVLLGWNWAMTGSLSAGSSMASGRRSYSALTVRKGLDRASTALMAVLSTNDEIKECKLTMRKAGGTMVDYFTITLKGARLTSLTHEVDADGSAAEQLAIYFTKVEVEYRPQDANGAAGGATTFADEILPA
jgi:type VI secretion system secreted protein Hcp